MPKIAAKFEDSELEGIEPIPYIPRIRYTSIDGVRFSGYYVFHNNTMKAFEEELNETDFDHTIIQDSFADWGMKRELKALKIIPDGGNIVLEWPDNCNTDNISDGYHTFGELYKHRAGLFATICNMFPELSWKSLKHEDGSMFPDMFIVGINTPKGPASYHYDYDPYWEWFDNVKQIDRAPHYDGYSDDESLKRVMSLCQ